MDSTLQADIQAVVDKDQSLFTGEFSVTITPAPVVPTPETVVFTPTAPSV